VFSAVVVGPGFDVVDVDIVRGEETVCEGEEVVVCVCWDEEGEEDAFVCCWRAEWALNAARKLDKKGRFVGIFLVCFDFGFLWTWLGSRERDREA